jgi:hypothetical protein
MIAIMKTISIPQIEAEIRNIQAELQALGPMHPGSISKQYQSCGRAGCKCMDPKDPQRHGPYNKLDYVYRGKKTCRFVRAGTEEELTERTAVYKRFRKLVDRWTELSIQRGAIEFFPSTKKVSKKKSSKASRPNLKPRS